MDLQSEVTSTRTIEFVGRRGELAELDQWYASNVPLALIVGLPGVGKSWLVKEWCARRSQIADFPIWYVDAAYAFIPTKAGPQAFVENLMRVIAFRLGLEIEDEIQLPLVDLASKVRQSGGLLVMDQLEVCLNRVKGTLAVGEPDPAFLEFINAFCSLSAGSGRIILVSNLRPARILEQQTIDRKYVTAISGGETRDPMQLGGLVLEDAQQFVQDRLKRNSGSLSEELFLEAYVRLEGHPKGIDLFLGLDSVEQVRFASQQRDQPLETNLRELMGFAVEPCSVGELVVLRLVALLRRPERDSFITDASHSLGAKEPDSVLDDLRRRSLVEYGQTPRAGYSAHGVVSGFVHATYLNEIEPCHLALAKEYESLCSHLASDAAVNLDLQLITEAAFHYHQAGKQFRQQATFWRDQLTQLSQEQGMMAYIEGDFESALQNLNEYIKAAPNLVQTPSTPRYLSYAYSNRAVTRHRKNFDWQAETADLRKALELDPTNLRALTFSITVIHSALRNGIPWSQIESGIAFFVDAARRFQSNSVRNDAACILIRLLVLWGDRVQDVAARLNVDEEFRLYLAEILSMTLSDLEHSTESNLVAYVELVDFLRRRASTPNDALELARRNFDLAKFASDSFMASSNLWMKRVEASLTLARFSETQDDRDAFLTSTQQALIEMQRHVSLPAGYARILADVTLELTHQVSREKAVERILETAQRLQSLRTESLALSLPSDQIRSAIPEDEIQAALIRLHVRAAHLAPEKADLYRIQALNIVEENLEDDDKWLTLEMAEQAINIVSGASIEHWDPGEKYEHQPKTENEQSSVHINRLFLTRLEQKIQKAEKLRPSSRFALLRLSLYVEYLKENWKFNDPQEPRAVARATKLAEDILGRGPETYEGLLVVCRLYSIIASRTSLEDKYYSAKAAGTEVLRRLSDNSKYPITGKLFWKAAFFRSLIEYKPARMALREYFKVEKIPYRRLSAGRLFLDAVAHSICREVIDHPHLDPDLLQDAREADQIYREHLSYLGLEHEDRNDRASAIRELYWIRCASFAQNFDLGDLSWVQRVYNNLGIEEAKPGIFVIHNAQVLGEFLEIPNQIAQILGHHSTDGSMWREVGTLLSILYRGDPLWREYTNYWWKMSKAIMELFRQEDHRGMAASYLTTLNLVRLSLVFPQSSVIRQIGQEQLAMLTQHSNMPWIYQRFVRELSVKQSFEDQSADESPRAKDQKTVAEGQAMIPEQKPNEKSAPAVAIPIRANSFLQKASLLKGTIDFGIITVREDEYRAVLKRFPPEADAEGSRPYALSHLQTLYSDCYRVAMVRCPEQGEAEGQNVARDMIEDLDPQWILLVGIAGTIANTEYSLGDVALAMRVHDFSVDASLEGRAPEYDVRGGPMHPAVQGLLAHLPAIEGKFEGWNSKESIGIDKPQVRLDPDNFYGDDDWKQDVKKKLSHHFGPESQPRAPIFYSGSIASSNRLVKNSETAKAWKSAARHLTGIEMELAGVYVAARRKDREYPILCIRGISDVVGFKREDSWTLYACHSAAAFTHALLKTRIIPARG